MPISANVLFINSLKNTGIGEFGSHLISSFIEQKEVELFFIETKPEWTTFISNWRKILGWKDIIIINLGFTSYGRSSVRNFLNFVMISVAKVIFRKDLRIILHDSPEISNIKSSGYKHFKLMKMGSYAATRFLRGTKCYVFSVQLHRILQKKYKLSFVKLIPFPCFTNKETTSKIPERIIVLSLGYWAPYKGLEFLPRLKKELPEIDFEVAGVPHKILNSTEEGERYFNLLKLDFETSGIKLMGFLSEAELQRLFAENRVVGVLPYLTTSGSSYAAAYFMERGVPLLSTNLPEFIFLKDNGAGIITVKRELKDFRNALTNLLTNEELYSELVSMNHKYCTVNDAASFIRILLK